MDFNRTFFDNDLLPKYTIIYIYIYIYIEECTFRQQVMIQASFIKDVGILFIMFDFMWGSKSGRPARTYIQQLCKDTGCGPEDLPEAMNDREKWRERVRDISACGTT